MHDNGRLGPDIIQTTDEEGNLHLFEKVEDIEFEGQRYALLIYQGTGEDAEEEEEEEGYEEEVVVMRVGMEDDAEVYEAIEDEDEFERVVQYIEELGFTEEDEEGDSDEAFHHN